LYEFNKKEFGPAVTMVGGDEYQQMITKIKMRVDINP
jgi:hypothetical protein